MSAKTKIRGFLRQRVQLKTTFHAAAVSVFLLSMSKSKKAFLLLKFTVKAHKLAKKSLVQILQETFWLKLFSLVF